MRRGVTKVILNSVIALVLVGLFFSTGFFVYSSFVKSLTTSQVTKGFKDFITPIQDVCQGKSEGAISNVNLPVTGDYTYGIFQTKLKQYTSSMPLVMRKCEDSYCLCLFKLRKPDGSVYDSWDDTPSSSFREKLANAANWGLPSITPSTVSLAPAPIWHFNTAGLRIFPSLMTRMIQTMLLRIADKIIILTLTYFITWFACNSAADAKIASGVGAALGLTEKAACQATLYAEIHILVGPLFEAIQAFIQEATEPFLLVNYPLNFMSTSNPEYLYWDNPLVSCSDADYCSDGDYFAGALKTASIDSTDWAAIGLAVTNRLLDEVVNSITNAITAGVGGKSAGAFKKVAFVVTNSAFKSGKWIADVKFKEWTALMSLDFDLPSSYRPTAYVRSLLGIRRVMNLDKFITMFADMDRLYHPFAVKTPHYDFSFDDSVRTFDGFDVVNCVAINELGPECDSNTKVLMDYDYDVFLSYRVTDPVNNPANAIFCGWNGAKDDYDFDFLDMALRAIKEGLGLDPDDSNVVLDWVFKFIDIAVGDWLLAGSTSAQGLLMECVQSHVNLKHRSEYFQYWVPYFDVSGQFGGYNGGINSMTAVLSNSVSQDSCESSVLSDWNDCVCFYMKHFKSDYDCSKLGSPTLNGLNDDKKPLEFLKVNIKGTYPFSDAVAEGYLDASSDPIDFHTTPLAVSYGFYKIMGDFVCPSDGAGGCDYSASWSNNITCIDAFYPKYLECKPGIHVRFNGVIQ